MLSERRAPDHRPAIPNQRAHEDIHRISAEIESKVEESLAYLKRAHAAYNAPNKHTWDEIEPNVIKYLRRLYSGSKAVAE